jgi:hypothetical protein
MSLILEAAPTPHECKLCVCPGCSACGEAKLNARRVLNGTGPHVPGTNGAKPDPQSPREHAVANYRGDRKSSSRSRSKVLRHDPTLHHGLLVADSMHPTAGTSGGSPFSTLLPRGILSCPMPAHSCVRSLLLTRRCARGRWSPGYA